MDRLTVDDVLHAYTIGLFPMAETAGDSPTFWVEPTDRGIIPLSDFHLPKRLKKTLKQTPFTIRCDTAFTEVMQACAARSLGRDETWINNEILRVYRKLHEMGFAHSIECWEDGELVGGLYGIALKGAFFGESMFSKRRDASKIALCHLVARLKNQGYRLLDTQFQTEHLKQFGTIEIPQADYLLLLDDALKKEVAFAPEKDVAIETLWT